MQVHKKVDGPIWFNLEERVEVSQTHKEETGIADTPNDHGPEVIW